MPKDSHNLYVQMITNFRQVGQLLLRKRNAASLARIEGQQSSKYAELPTNAQTDKLKNRFRYNIVHRKTIFSL